ncbi:MAG: protein-disulfide reductase DsbD [Gammaproteobacteria bacterium]
MLHLFRTRRSRVPPHSFFLFALCALALGAGAHASILSNLLNHSGNRFLPANQAFVLKATRTAQNRVLLVWRLAPGYYLYRLNFRFAVLTPSETRLAAPHFPKATLKNDGTFGWVHVFFNHLTLVLDVHRTEGKPLTLSIRYQGCSEKGLCYPPIIRRIGLPASSIESVPTPPATGGSNLFAANPARLAQSAPLWAGFLAFVVLGILLAFTPCSAPMIPIIVTIMTREGSRRVWSLLPRALAYILALSLTYTAAGIVAGLLGHSLSTILETPWVIGLLSALFVALALSMFGCYELRLPQAFQAWCDRRLATPKGQGALLGSAAMGVVSAVLVGPCLVPPLAAALLVIADNGAVLRGGVLLFGLGIGMGIPLLVFGLSAGKLWPRSGPWLRATNTLLGLLLLGVAVWYLSDILPMPWILGLTGLLSLIAGAFLRQPLRSAPERLGSGYPWLVTLESLLMIVGAIYLVGASLGSRSELHPLKPLLAHSTRVEPKGSRPGASGIHWITVTSLTSLDQALTRARQQGRPAVVDFWARWCISCRLMDRAFNQNRTVQSVLRKVATIRVDITRDDPNSRMLLKHFRILGPPTFLFYTNRGHRPSNDRLIGESSLARFMRHLRVVAPAA